MCSVIFTTATSDFEKRADVCGSGSGEDVAPGHRVSCTKTLKKGADVESTS